MLILGIDSSSIAASVAICEDDKTIVNYTLNHKRTHSEKLLEMIDMALKIARINISDIDLYAVTNGPGSFTGLRIGLATVKGLCHANNKKALLTSSLNALYENVSISDNDILICPIMDARRKEVYTALYLNGEKILKDSAISLDRLFEIIDNKNVLFTGDGVLVYKDYIKKMLGKKAAFASEQFLLGSGASVIKSAMKDKIMVDYNNINPVYLRVSQAERLRNEEKNK